MQFEARLEELRLVLPKPAKPRPGIGGYPSGGCWYMPTEPTSTVPLNLDDSVEGLFGKVGGGSGDQQCLAAGLKGANEPGDASSLPICFMNRVGDAG